MEQHKLVRIPVILKGPNYITWSRLTRTALGGRGLWEHITTSREFDTLDVISPASQDYNIYMLEILPPKYKMYVETCMDKMEPIGKCGLYVIKEILTNEPVSRECCLKVVRAGKECFIETNKLMFQFYQLKRFVSQVSFKINEVWNRCSAEVESPSSSADFAI
ncbi:hypothetical protein F2Q69_00038653 [Brassica cretica]|uniref:Prolamin-like domain-containing protein n=1 Tax=Brassica cretica TaxID=69181 RepID=A0A8S9SDP5_BRACR|nr:hypothetical protein F2Q69_00038653 [Brassica cretica]